jgi:hypothetical protein
LKSNFGAAGILLNRYLADWHESLPMLGLAVLGAAALYFVFRKKPEDQGEAERLRRAYLNRIGRIAEGQIVEFSDHSTARPPLEKAAQMPLVRQAVGPGSAPKLLYYSYSISGVTYETAQDVSGLEEQAHLHRIVAGQHASVKYDPANPSNSILLADDWSGIS